MLDTIGGEKIAVPLGAGENNQTGLLRLNEVGAFLWEKLMEGTTEEDLVQDVTPEQVAACLADYYQGESQVLVHPLNELPEDKFLTTNLRTGSDKMENFVVGHESQLLVMSLFDNLGKGSSGAAVQCMNLMLGLPETEGLE